MDIAGAKALKERLGHRGKTEARPAAATDVPEHAPPVYHYLGVSETPTDPRSGVQQKPWTRRLTWLRRLSRPLR